jgi:glycosyltransferase involved in cell wall biosynthesis
MEKPVSPSLPREKSVTILHTEEMGVIGGQSLRVLEDLKIIRELGHQPILACKGANWIAREAEKYDIETIDIPFKHRADLGTIKQLHDLIRERKVDIVHTHSSIDSYLATYPAKLLGCKVVRSRHSELSKRPGHIYKIVDAIVTTGEKVAEQLKATGVTKPKIISIPSCPDERYFVPSPSRRREARQYFKVGGNSCVYNAPKYPDSQIPSHSFSPIQ